MARLFGTDGIRGVANRDLTPDLALALGRAAGIVLGKGRIVLGRDTRVSGPMLSAALSAGLCSAGCDVLDAGVIPTPAVALLTVAESASGGAVISASHNPVADNGIKFFSPEGVKLSADLEAAIEDAMTAQGVRSEGVDVGTLGDLRDAEPRYIKHLLATLDGGLSGLRVVLDCAHGAAWRVAPEVFRSAGADVVTIHDTPDGSRINVDCGSTSLREVASVVTSEGAHLGLAFDGDADRVLAVDELGNEVDGDRIIGLIGLGLLDDGKLEKNLIVGTVMSNLGFIKALEERGVDFIASPVGDKHVAEAMVENGAILGGEQSGHVIFGNFATTGDGVLTALQLAAAVNRADSPLSRLAGFFEPYPQVLLNVRVGAKDRLEEAAGLWDDVARAEAELGDEGRILVRASGTESLVRVMVEASSPDVARETAERLAEAVRAHLS
jgi:phosphoglucosamine mutase